MPEPGYTVPPTKEQEEAWKKLLEKSIPVRSIKDVQFFSWKNYEKDDRII